MLNEINHNEFLIRNESSDIVYGHQDLLRGNVLRNASGEILLVDFEYTCLLAAPLDICHHYCEWMTRYDSQSYWIDVSLHPSHEEEVNFVAAYLERRHGEMPKETEVEAMIQKVHRMQCFSFFFWYPHSHHLHFLSNIFTKNTCRLYDQDDDQYAKYDRI